MRIMRIIKCPCLLSVLPAAVQKEVEGKAMDYIIRIVMSSFAFHDGIICKGCCHSISV